MQGWPLDVQVWPHCRHNSLPYGCHLAWRLTYLMCNADREALLSSTLYLKFSTQTYLAVHGMIHNTSNAALLCYNEHG